jgi:tRNA-specific 2-thiouridylase
MPTRRHRDASGKRKRALVAMSGGVDSSVAAALLVEAGYEVVGVTLQLAGAGSSCCAPTHADAARRVAEQLGIGFCVVDQRERFRREVVEAFADAYLAGRTPIPCVRCNSGFKFDCLLERARRLDASAIASGHYARVDTDRRTGRRRLLRAADPQKDQTYFLFELSQEQLAAVRFPLGDLKKTEVREHARRLGLAAAERPESQEICFVPDGDAADAVERIRPGGLPGEGLLVDAQGRVLGRHAGVHRFTVGQRRGLGIASERRLYVTRIEADENRVVVGGHEELLAGGARLEGVNWIAGAPPGGSVDALVRVRYRHTGMPARVEPERDGGARVVFDDPVPAVAPGQAAVFERDAELLGGGWIAEALP